MRCGTLLLTYSGRGFPSLSTFPRRSTRRQEPSGKWLESLPLEEEALVTQKGIKPILIFRVAEVISKPATENRAYQSPPPLPTPLNNGPDGEPRSSPPRSIGFSFASHARKRPLPLTCWNGAWAGSTLTGAGLELKPERFHQQVQELTSAMAETPKSLKNGMKNKHQNKLSGAFLQT